MRFLGRKDGLAANADPRQRTKGQTKRAIVAKSDNLADHILAHTICHREPAADTHGVKRTSDLDDQPLDAKDAAVMFDFGNLADFCQQCSHRPEAPFMRRSVLNPNNPSKYEIGLASWRPPGLTWQ